MQQQSNNDEDSKCKSKILGGMYDVLAQIISVLDVTTDIIVCIQYYQNDRMIFFCISLSILCLACIAYDITFMMNYSDEVDACRKIGLFLIVLPISPFIPFFIFFTTDPNSEVSTFLEVYCCFDIYIRNRVSTSNSSSKLRQFMESKLKKHLGFIVEAFVEAFPQAILQMTCIVLYKEANILAIISILISLLSVATKSLVFSIATAITLKQVWFNWLSAVSDFFALFFIVSWVFYTPENEDLQDAFILIQSIWLYRLFICTIPMVFCASIIGFVVLMDEFAPNCDECKCDDFTDRCLYFLTFLLVLVMWCCGMIASVLVAEMLAWTWLAGTFWWLGTRRYPKNKTTSEYLFTLIAWINAAKKHHVGSAYTGVTSYTRKQDRMMRLCSLNYMAMTDECCIDFTDDNFKQYLENQKQTQYMNVTMQNLRTESWNAKESQFFLKFWKWYGEIWSSVIKTFKSTNASRRNYSFRKGKWCEDFFYVIIVAPITFFGGPLYFFSKLVNLLFPLFIILYLYFGYNVNVWSTNDIDLFQIMMISIHIFLCSMLAILFYFNYCEQYLMAHIVPSKHRIFANYDRIHDINKEIKVVTNYYYGIVVIPMRKAMIIEKFGKDLGAIILSYLPDIDEYETSDNDINRIKIV